MESETMPAKEKRESGFSVVEALIAAALLLIMAVGILPLFLRAMSNNYSGSESTRISNFGKSQVEDLFQLDFNHADVTITANTENVLPEQFWAEGDPGYASDANEGWTVGPLTPAHGSVLWHREAMVRQYSTEAFVLIDEANAIYRLDPAAALPAGTDAGQIHLKEIDVDVTSDRAPGGPLGPRRRLGLRTFKAK
jgi:hypothetical protein